MAPVAQGDRDHSGVTRKVSALETGKDVRRKPALGLDTKSLSQDQRSSARIFSTSTSMRLCASRPETERASSVYAGT